MKKRIARLPVHNAAPLLAGHTQLQRILRRHLPPSTARLYAAPKQVNGDTVEWYCDLDGQPVPFAELDPQQAASVRRVLNERLASIRYAADHLPADRDNPQQLEQARQLLREAAQLPADEHIYVLNGQPVVTAWIGIPPPGVPTPPAPAAAPPPPPPRRRWWYWRRRWRWWWLLLLLLIALLLWWWFCQRPMHSGVALPVAEADLCLDESLVAPAPERAAAPAPELVVVFDASGSMDYSMRPWFWGLFHPPWEPRRIAAARQATGIVVQSLPDDVNAGLVLLETCPAARRVGFFQAVQRGKLLELVEGIIPQGGTPLADGIANAGEMLDGVNRESVMLVVSDGGESCGGDPCAIARQLAQQKPQLKINVVDIGGTGAGNCLAQATGGQVFTANTAQELQVMTTRAARDVLRPEHCRR